MAKIDLKQSFSEFAECEELTYKDADRLLFCTFNLLLLIFGADAYPKEIFVDSEFGILTIGNDNNALVKLGRRNILKGKKLLAHMVRLFKTEPDKFMEVYLSAVEKSLSSYCQENKEMSEIILDVRTSKVSDYHRRSEIDDDYSFGGRHCPACQQAPCMCSDPQWHWD